MTSSTCLPSWFRAKGDVTRRMPVLGHDDAVPGILFEHFMDDGHDLVALRVPPARAPGKKILLQVDDDHWDVLS